MEATAFSIIVLFWFSEKSLSVVKSVSHTLILFFQCNMKDSEVTFHYSILSDVT